MTRTLERRCMMKILNFIVTIIFCLMTMFFAKLHMFNEMILTFILLEIRLIRLGVNK